jgi:hypothetical protein
MLTDFIFSLPALFFILFIPGYALVSALYPKKPLEWPEKILTAILLSITLNIISTLALNVILNIPFQLSALMIQNALFIIVFSAAYFIRLRRVPRFYLELHEYNTEKFLKTPAVIILLLSTVLLAYSVHLSYQFPFLPDEWNQISEAKKIIDNNRITDSGFQLLLAQIYIMTGQIPAYYSIYLPAIFSGLAALGICVFAKKITDSTHIALLSILFFAGLKSNGALSGAWFLTPAVLAAAFIFAILYFLTSGLEEKSKTKTGIAGLLMLGLASIEPLSAALTAIVFLIYHVIRRKEAKENILQIGVFYLITVVALLITLSPLFGTTTQTPKLISAPQYPILYYGIIPFVLALIGALYCIKKNKSNTLILSWAALVLVLIIIFQIAGLTILMPYAQTLYLSLLILAVLSACGLYWILEVINSKIRINVVAALISILLIAASAYALFPDYYDSTKSLGKPMDDRTYDAIKWLARTKGNASLVLTRPEIAPIIPAITSNLTTLNTTSSKDVYEYFMSDCSGKKDIIRKYNVTYVLVSIEDKIDCEFLPWIYIQKGIYIYEVDKTLLV